MTRFFPDYPDAVMVYTAGNEYAVVPASDLPAALAAGWAESPTGTLAVPPAPFEGALDFAPPAATPWPHADLAAMTKAQIVEHAQSLGVALTADQTKAELIQAVQAAQPQE